MSAGGQTLRWFGRWCARHRRWCGLWIVVAALGPLLGEAGSALWALGVALGPGGATAVWHQAAPASYERLAVAPTRRVGWWWYSRRRWAALARLCGLSERQVVGSRLSSSGPPREVTRWVAPRLVRVRTRPHAVELTVRARAGQTLGELEAGAERLATTFAAVSHRVTPVSGSSVVIELVMLDELAAARIAREPDQCEVDGVRLGRRQSGADWMLRLGGRHTLVAGCSGAGKGSVLWGVAGGLAPAIHADVARLWGIDLKRGIELAMGADLFCTRADTPAEALDVLRALLRVIDQRGASMVGRTRSHEPTRGDPLHVLVIDELAALTAYAEPEVRKEATRLLSEILTQGRALGIVVLACVQDPRKDVVSMRGLFTQTLALRLRSVEETVMSLGEGMSRVAPAHRISPAAPGTAWVVEDTGAADRVRADFWPDELVRQVARKYPTGVRVDTAPAEADTRIHAPADCSGSMASSSPRPPRTTRRPRSPRRSAVNGIDTSGEGAA